MSRASDRDHFSQEAVERRRSQLLTQANPPAEALGEEEDAKGGSETASDGRMVDVLKKTKDYFVYTVVALAAAFTAVALLVFIAPLVIQALSSTTVPFCSSDANSRSLGTCKPCPTQGLCDDTGRLISCQSGFKLSHAWGLLTGGPGSGACVPTWAAWLFAHALPWLPYVLVVAVVATWALSRRWRRRAEEAKIERWLATAWDLLNEDTHDQGDNSGDVASAAAAVPLDWLKVKIMRDEFGTAAAARNHEWLWDRKVLPELLGDPRLRVEPRVVQGEHKECVSVLSPKALRRKSFGQQGSPTPGGGGFGGGQAVESRHRQSEQVLGSFTFGGGVNSGGRGGGDPQALQTPTTPISARSPMASARSAGAGGGATSRRRGGGGKSWWGLFSGRDSSDSPETLQAPRFK